MSQGLSWHEQLLPEKHLHLDLVLDVAQARYAL